MSEAHHDQTENHQAGTDEKPVYRAPGPDQKVTAVHWLQYLLLRWIAFWVWILPGPLARLVGLAIGRFAHAIDGKHRKIALLNLDQAFFDSKTESEKRWIVQTCYDHFGQAIVETLRLSMIHESNFTRYAELDNVGGFYKARDEGKGLILCTAHYGNWELMNLVLGLLNIQMSVVARPIDNPLVHTYLENIRTRNGNRVIYKHKAVRKLLSALKENRVVGLVNDQNVHDRNKLMVEFFGREAATTPTPAALAYKTGAPIITGYAVPIGRGRYRLSFGDLIYADQTADKEAEVLRLSREINRRLENQIMFNPPYWFWVHKRFKHGVDGETDFYKRERNV
ncbi:lysophospholipid acyltransferase family protein [Acanthopleuribacter pedis]|uniref:Lysophospholipid acyltransferase family protein n=1 Tax=Acanthopleuribacter pedis TaxID=442870 RepID=A0A8J7U524_9BACT|nr:lysophospholipid acyltransferase family protein [Acanthopleuribacter pedis]MBO1320053.1 lysophospholipid acyltransferase family protein [Acanthopleuribacter pedis]